MEVEVEEEAPESSGCAGAAVITAAVLGSVLGLYAASRTAFILLIWALGWGAVIWVAKQTPKSVRGAAIPAPPAPSERGSEKKPQVTGVRDRSHPNRWAVAAPSPWMDWEPDERGES